MKENYIEKLDQIQFDYATGKIDINTAINKAYGLGVNSKRSTYPSDEETLANLPPSSVLQNSSIAEFMKFAIDFDKGKNKTLKYVLNEFVKNFINESE